MTEETLKTAFNIAVRYGFCGVCRFSLGDKNCVKHDCYSYVKQIEEVCEKRIPKKPIFVYGLISHYECQECGCFVGTVADNSSNYCCSCGQKILWEDES